MIGNGARRIVLALAGVLLIGTLSAQQSEPLSATEIPKNQLVQPEQLEHELESHGAASPLILQVGSHLLFNEAHIAGAEYAGPGSQGAGLEALRSRVTALPRSRPIVIYCGCCPWNRCPNIGPAWRLLHQMGFTHLRVLYLADNFGTDWVAKGYRAEKAQ